MTTLYGKDSNELGYLVIRELIFNDESILLICDEIGYQVIKNDSIIGKFENLQDAKDCFKYLANWLVSLI